jgi:hypothetical protein
MDNGDSSTLDQDAPPRHGKDETTLPVQSLKAALILGTISPAKSARRWESRALPPDWGPRRLPVPAAFRGTNPQSDAEPEVSEGATGIMSADFANAPAKHLQPSAKS